jgi:YhcH/YjgK/YiaL family protein
MILDSLRNSELYSSINPGFAKAFELLKEPAIRDAEVGKQVFIPGSLFMSVEEYDGKNRTEGLWEAHRKFIDIQFVVKGIELMGRRDVSSLRSLGGYDEERDIEFFGGDDPGDFFKTPEGSFAVFFPHDAHMPSLKADDNGQSIKKIVFKIAIPKRFSSPEELS